MELKIWSVSSYILLNRGDCPSLLIFIKDSIMDQFEIENKFSHKRISEQLKLMIETHHLLLEAMYDRLVKWLRDYRNSVYGQTYTSKDERLAKIEPKLDDMPANILFSVLSLGECTLQGVATKIGSYIEEDTILAAKSGAEMLAICDGLGYDIIRPVLGSGQTFLVRPKIVLSIEDSLALKLSMFLPPMITTPDAWTNNHNGGYYTSKEHVILGDRFNKHNKELNLHVLNILQDVKYVLDMDIASEPDTIDLESIDPKHQEQAKANFEQMLKENSLVYDMYKDQEFSFVFQYDKRGRIYSKGYHINIQGNPYRKAMLKFAKKEKLTDRGWYWLKVDLANAYGLDKETFDVRVKFIDDNIDDILRCPDHWIAKADEPLLFKSALKSYKESLKTGYSNHIVRLDATSSGPQIMSVVMRDKIAMKYLNVLGQERTDYYTLVAKQTYERTKGSSIWGDNPSWKDIRSQTKKATMTFYYNSTAKPEEFFGKDTKELHEYYSVIKELTQGACKLQDIINSLWDDTKDTNEWYLPDNHLSYCPVRKTKKTKIEVKEMRQGTAVFNFMATVHQAGHEEYRSLAPNVVHSLDAFVCRTIIEMLSEQGIEVSPIHDSFGVHANHCDALRKVYRNLMARLYREDIIDDILSQIADKEISLDKFPYETDIEKEIRNNDQGYYIC